MFRSPLAAAAFNQHIEAAGLSSRILAESAGILEEKAGQPANPTAADVALDHGLDLSQHISRAVDPLNLSEYRLVIGMEEAHVTHLLERCHPNDEMRLKQFLHFHPTTDLQDLPNPYDQPKPELEKIYQLINQTCEFLVADVTAQILA